MLKTFSKILQPATRSCFLYQCKLKYSTTEINEKTGIATLSLNRAPVNSLNLEFVENLNESIKKIEYEKCSGIIITSANDGTFSAGLDLSELYKPKEQRLRAFWTAFQDLWLTLFGSSVPTVAVINGHSPAGGCVLSTSCEYRIMLPKYTIGLNEPIFSITAPKFVLDTFAVCISKRNAELALSRGSLLSTTEAVRLGLVDEMCNTKTEALRQAEKFIASFNNTNPVARALTKQQFRSKIIEELKREKLDDVKNFVNMVMNAEVQINVENYYEKLKSKK